MWHVVAGGIVTGLLIAVVCGRWLARTVIGPLEELRHGVGQLAAGNMTHRLEEVRNDELGELVGAFNSMASALQKSDQALRELASRDPLTGLFNHRHLTTILKEEIDRCRRYDRGLALLMMDLDGFKKINDTQGHLAGDQVLKALADLINGQMRQSDFAFRYGGDEFVVLLTETDRDQALEFAGRILRSAAATRVRLENGRTVTIGLSIGVAAFPEDGGNDTAVLAAADHALYTAKEQGRGRAWPAG